MNDTTPPYSKAKYGFGDELEAGLYKVIDEKIESIGDLVIENERLKKQRDEAVRLLLAVYHDTDYRTNAWFIAVERLAALAAVNLPEER
jgi:hypothetical protein